jgi:hypothetical protein
VKEVFEGIRTLLVVRRYLDRTAGAHRGGERLEAAERGILIFSSTSVAAAAA